MTTIAKTPHTTRNRSIAKAVSWRLLGSMDTFVVSYIVTGQFNASAFIVSAEVITKTLLYYLHERGWAHLRWGVVLPAAKLEAQMQSAADVYSHIGPPANSDETLHVVRAK